MPNLMDFPKRDHVDALPAQSDLDFARSQIFKSLSKTLNGMTQAAIVSHLNNLSKGLSNSSLSRNYYGFVTGGVTPAAATADHMVTTFDQNVQVHLPGQSIATEIEDAALRMLAELLYLETDHFRHRIFTTGATASNVLGLACGREYVVQEAARRRTNCQQASETDISIGELGILEAMSVAGLSEIKILTTTPHSSLLKASSIVGLGRKAILDVSVREEPHRFDLKRLQTELQVKGRGCIVSISCGEINTGRFATTLAEMVQIRDMCDMYGAWVHVDGAFGLLGRILPSGSTDNISDSPSTLGHPLPDSYSSIATGCGGMELADSITGDSHKLLNVPYDCGFFFSRDLAIATQVFQNAGAAYLGGSITDPDTITSPLHIGIENSRRFRAFPVYATLVAHGRYGIEKMLRRQIKLVRKIAEYIRSNFFYELLPHDGHIGEHYIVVLFRLRVSTKLRADYAP